MRKVKIVRKEKPLPKIIKKPKKRLA